MQMELALASLDCPGGQWPTTNARQIEQHEQSGRSKDATRTLGAKGIATRSKDATGLTTRNKRLYKIQLYS